MRLQSAPKDFLAVVKMAVQSQILKDETLRAELTALVEEASLSEVSGDVMNQSFEEMKTELSLALEENAELLNSFFKEGSFLIQDIQIAATGLPLPGDFEAEALAKNESIELKWNESTDATSYSINCGTTAGSYTSVVKENATSPLVDTNLKNGVSYFYMVTAINEHLLLYGDSIQ